MQIYRQGSCQIARPEDYTAPLVFTNNLTNFLYLAYVGRGDPQ